MLFQLPPRCIRRATDMASRLESVVNSRIQCRSRKDLLSDTPVIDQDQEAQQLMPQHHDHSSPDFGRACVEFLSNLKATMDHDDLGKSFHFFEHAKGIARELLSRYHFLFSIK